MWKQFSLFHINQKKTMLFEDPHFHFSYLALKFVSEEHINFQNPSKDHLLLVKRKTIPIVHFCLEFVSFPLTFNKLKWL